MRMLVGFADCCIVIIAKRKKDARNGKLLKAEQGLNSETLRGASESGLCCLFDTIFSCNMTI